MIKLPSHPESKISDPLSVLDTEDYLVSYWDFLVVLFGPLLLEGDINETPQDRLSRLIAALETLCYSLTGRGSPNFSLLLEPASAILLSHLIKPIIKRALDMKKIFPSGTLSILQTSPELESLTATVMLTRPQITCLVCHMLLGTFSKPTWMSWDGPNLEVWFADDEKGDRKIKSTYIHVLLAYLEAELVSGRTLEGARDAPQMPGLSFSLFDGGRLYDVNEPSNGDSNVPMRNLLDSNRNPLTRLQIHTLQEEDDDYDPCFATSMENDVTLEAEICQLVSANKEIGFGPTATQEERMFGSSPLLLPSVLFTPPLLATQCLLISGNTEMYGHFTGHLRSAQLRRLYSSSERRSLNRSGRSFLFLDALEMDGDKHGKDLEIEIILRELHKLMSGFNALAHHSRATGRRSIAVVPPWGCGAFGGDFKVKLLLIWIAASVCGISELRCAVKESWWLSLDADWRALIDRIRCGADPTGAWDVIRLWKLVTSLESKTRTQGIVDWLNS